MPSSNGSCMLPKSRRVSTRTKGLVSSTKGAGRSRGTRTGCGSAAIAACTAAILLASEFTHCNPEDCATSCKLSVGSAYPATLGMPAVLVAVGDAARGAAIGATASGAAATGAGVVGATLTAAGAGTGEGAAAACGSWETVSAVACSARSGRLPRSRP